LYVVPDFNSTRRGRDVDAFRRESGSCKTKNRYEARRRELVGEKLLKVRVSGACAAIN
jgi:hypothetical protein